MVVREWRWRWWRHEIGRGMAMSVEEAGLCGGDMGSGGVGGGILLLLGSVTCFLKLVSWAHVCAVIPLISSSYVLPSH